MGIASSILDGVARLGPVGLHAAVAGLAFGETAIFLDFIVPGEVGMVVAGRRMGEEGEAAARDAEKGRDRAEQLGRDGQLDAAARMGPDRPLVEMADRHAKPLLRGAGKRLGPIHLARVKVDVGVEILDVRLRHGTSFSSSLDFAANIQGTRKKPQFPDVFVTTQSPS